MSGFTGEMVSHNGKKDVLTSRYLSRDPFRRRRSARRTRPVAHSTREEHKKKRDARRFRRHRAHLRNHIDRTRIKARSQSPYFPQRQSPAGSTNSTRSWNSPFLPVLNELTGRW